MKCSLFTLVAVCGLLWPCKVFGHSLAQPQEPTTPINPGSVIQAVSAEVDIDVEVRRADGAPVAGQVMVQLLELNGRVRGQEIVKKGHVKFYDIPRSVSKVLVMAPGYERAEQRIEALPNAKEVNLTIDLYPKSDLEEAAFSRGLAALSPKAQKDVGKALEALRANKPKDARSHLEAAKQKAPNSAEVEYLYGVCASKLNEPAEAQEHWMKALDLNPKHLSALLAISQRLILENKADEAMPYLSRAQEDEPSSWRTQALLAQAVYLQGKHDEAIEHAERAIELGHERAASMQLFLAQVLAQSGEKGRAVGLLQDYLKTNPAATAAAKQLERWKNPQARDAAADDSITASEMGVMDKADTDLPSASNWLPPDVDEKIPPVEAGAVCTLDDVLQKAGDKVAGLIHDVDRFTATESLMDQTIDKWGVASAPQKRKFDYVVSIQEIRRGNLAVEEYRNSRGMPVEFPEGIITNGLPSLVLIFHPYYAPNYEMTCEGLARWNGGLAWQVHFRQRKDKPVANKSYQFGFFGPSYPVALKGRAWISAENYQIERLETDLVAPVPQIRLAAEHTAIEYGSVNFRRENVNLWLPESAEVYFDWKGRRIHRRHSFSNYMLFAVDEKERIAAPKVTEAPANAGAGETQSQ